MQTTPEIAKARSRLEGLRAKRSTVFEEAGKRYFHLRPAFGQTEDRKVPAAFLERWIREQEIDLGLLVGRAMEDDVHANS